MGGAACYASQHDGDWWPPVTRTRWRFMASQRARGWRGDRVSARLLPAGRVRAGMTVTHLGRRVTVDGVRKQALDMSFEGLT